MLGHTLNSDNMLAAMRRNRMRKADIARRLQVHRSTVSRWIHGDLHPDDDTVNRLCALLHMQKGDLVIDDNSPATAPDG